MSETICPNCRNTRLEPRHETAPRMSPPPMLRPGAVAGDRLGDLAEMPSRLEARLDRMLKPLA